MYIIRLKDYNDKYFVFYCKKTNISCWFTKQCAKRFKTKRYAEQLAIKHNGIVEEILDEEEKSNER